MAITADVFEVQFRGRNDVKPAADGAVREMSRVERASQALGQFANVAGLLAVVVGKLGPKGMAAGAVVGAIGVAAQVASVALGILNLGIRAVTATIRFAIIAGRGLLQILAQMAPALGVGSAGAVGLALAGARAAANWEVLGAQLQVVTKSAERAREIQQFAEALAAPSPFFDTEPLAKAAMQLEAFGLHTERYLPLAASMASIFGQNTESLMAFVSALGRVRAGSAEGFERLRESFGITRAMLEEQGLRFDNQGRSLGTPEQGLAAVERVVRTRFAGTDEAFQETFMARFRSMIDAMQRAMRTLGAPLLDIFAPFVESVTRLAAAIGGSGVFARALESFAGLVDPARFELSAIRIVAAVGALMAQLPNIARSVYELVQSAAALTVRIVEGMIQGVDAILLALSGLPIIGPAFAGVRLGTKAGVKALSDFFTGEGFQNMIGFDMQKFRDDYLKNYLDLKTPREALTAPPLLALPDRPEIGAQVGKGEALLEQIEKNTRREVELTQTLLGGGELARIGASSAELWAARRAGSRHAADLRGAFARLVVGRA